MDNSSYRNLYIAELTENRQFSEASAITTQNFWKRVQRFENDVGKTLEEGYTKEEFIRLISSFNVSNVSGFLGDKSRIKKYLEWLVEKNGFDSDIVADISTVKYDDIDAGRLFELKFFKDFQDLQDTIETTLVVADKVDERIFATQIAAIYMAWCGLQMEEALQIKKSDVEDDCIRVGNRKIYPNQTIMEFIKDYRDATEYQSAAKAIITLKYAPSEFLFRTARSGCVDSSKTMRIFIRNFGKSGGEDSNIFHYDKVYWSGVYNRAYLYECANGMIRQGDIETISKLFNESYTSISVANKRLQAYRKFVQYFFPSK